MKKTAVWMAFFLVVAFFSNCRSAGDPDQPPRILLGQDPCDECRMIINEERFAAAFTTAGGQRRYFDDIGCMLANQKKIPQSASRFWVADFRNGAWLPADKAVFITGTEIMTPMGFGIVAIDREAYQSGRPLQGRAVAFNELLTMNIRPASRDELKHMK